MEAPRKLRITIAGAGLGGLTAALRLAQDGHQVQLLERSKQLSTASGAIYIRSNAVRCFRRWGLNEVFKTVTTEIRHHQTRNALNNDLLQSFSNFTFSDVAEWATDREALQNTLYAQAVQAGAQIAFNVSIARVEENGNEAIAISTDTTRYTSDLFLAADGISSRLRTQILPGHDPNSLAPIASPSTHYPTELPKAVIESNEITKEIITAPTSDDSIMWAGNGGYLVGKYNHARRLFNLMFSVQNHGQDDIDNPRLFDEVGDVNSVRDFFGKCHPLLKALSDMMESCSRWRLARLDPLDRWSSPGRRLVLLGDSAHAMLPNLAQGFSSIVEDIDALSIILENGGGVSDMIQTWEEFRIPRVTKLQDNSLFNYQLYNAGQAPGHNLTQEEKALPMGEGDMNAPYNSPPSIKWIMDYDVAAEVKKVLTRP